MLSPAAAAKGRRRGPTVLESLREADKRAEEAALAKVQESARRARMNAEVVAQLPLVLQEARRWRLPVTVCWALGPA